MKLRNIYFVVLSLLLLASCKKVLDKRDLTALPATLTFNDSVLARTYIDYIYDQNLPPWGGTSGLQSTISEESAANTTQFLGTVQVNDISDFGTALANNNNYAKIRTINIFLEEIEKSTLGTSWINLLKGQAYFFRAWRYWELVKLYGGVPLVLTPLQAVGDEAKEADLLPRNKTSECIAQISKDLDLAFELLPGKWTDQNNDWGRVTKGAAAALKARVLLYWASPQFTPTDITSRWQAAYDAAKLAKTTLLANGYGLNSSFDNMWFQEKGNPEAVFITGYNSLTSDQTKKNNGYDNSTRPAFAGTGSSTSSNQPTKELVDAFPMKDGKPRDSSATYPYNAQTFYKNRDPRFDKTIAYNGCTWTLNNITYNRFWYYLEGSNPTVGPSGNKVATTSGFFCRKAIDPKPATGDVQYSGTDWMEIRFAEVLLTLAEAANGIGSQAEAYTELKAIRARAGIVAGSDGMYGLKQNMARDEMFKAILNERLYEFAFEGKRYWDLRRWKLFESTLNGKKRTGITVTFKISATYPSAAAFTAQRDNIPLDDAYLNNFTIASKVLDTYFPNGISWKPEYYFFAIPQSAINNNPALVQNVGWGGAFDPLQ